MSLIIDDDFIEFEDYICCDIYNNNVPLQIPDYSNPLVSFKEEKFLKRFRFSKQSVQFRLLPLVYYDGTNCQRGLPVPPLMKLTTALRFYTTGSFQVVCGDLVNISQPTVHRIVKEVSEILARHVPKYVSFPKSEVERNYVKHSFRRIAGFPNVLGAIDCTHIPIISPGGPNAEVFRNRKGFFSMNVQAVAGPDLTIFDIVIRWPGSTHDSRIFANSGIRTRFEGGDLKGFLLGDSGDSQSKYLHTPVLNPTTAPQRKYNVSQRSTRNVIERTFGVLKRRFPCLHKGLRNKLRTTTRVIAACVVLHNLGRQWDQLFEEDEEEKEERFDHLLVEVENARETERGRIVKEI